MKDDRGITLVELLATITLLSIIGILVWNVFIQGIKNSNEGSTKVKLTQEMNYVQTTLRNIHQTSDYYKITFPTTCSIKVEFDDENSSEPTFLLFEDDQICYEIKNAKTKKNNKKDASLDLNKTEIDPKREHHFILFDLVLTDKNNERNKVNTRTNLSRLQNFEEEKENEEKNPDSSNK